MANATSTGQAIYVVQDITAWAVILLNIIFILIVMTHKDLRRCPRNHLLVSLAVSDLLTGSVYCAFYGMNFREVSSYLLVMVFIARLFNNAAIIFESYMAISKPFKYRAFMARFCRFIIASCWVVAVIIILAPLLCRNDPNPGLKRKISIFLLLLGIVVPYSFSCVTFFLIFGSIKEQRRLLLCLTKFTGTPMMLRHLKGKRNEVHFCVLATLALSLSGLPLIYMTTVPPLFVKPVLISPFLSNLSNVFIIVVSLINTLINSFKNPDIRDAVRHRLQSVFLFRSSRVSPSNELYQL